MFSSFLKNRPKHLLAVYLESHHVEVLRAHRQWRSWQVDPVEQFTVPEGENPYDYLQRLNLRARHRQHTALLLILPHPYFTFHREHYPATLLHQLDEALAYDWPENLFYEHERTLHFAGPAVPVDHQLSVPVFSLQNEIFEKFNQSLGGQSFQTFSIVPSALGYRTFLPAPPPADQEAPPLTLLARVVDPSHLEVHRFYKGHLLDSELISKNPLHMKLFLERVKCGGNGIVQTEPCISLLCTEQEHASKYAEDWLQAGLPLEIRSIDAPLLSHWVKDLLQQDKVGNFNDSLILKPVEIPKVTWFLAPLILLYSIFAFYQLHSYDQLAARRQVLRQQQTQLENDWKPIEQLQNRVAKFKQDQKTLSEFHIEGYPVLEMLTLLSKITPQDTWLNYLSFRRGELLLRGESKSAIKYLSILSGTGGFENVRFASPVTRNPATDMERFNINAQLDIAKLDKTISKSLPASAEKSAVLPQPGRTAAAQPQPNKAKSPIGENAKKDHSTAEK